MTRTPLRAHRLAMALALAATVAPGLALAQSSKDQQHARLIELQTQMDQQKGQAGFSALQAEFMQISAALGGDVPCAVGPSSVGNSGSRVAPPSPTGCAAATSTFTQSTAVPIADATVSTSTVVVSGAGAYLWDVDLTTFITHTFSADMDITITSPAGTVVTLSSDNGSGNDNVFNGTVWDDDANPAGAVPYTTNAGLVTDHPYVNLTLASPLVPEESLSAFVGENPNGTWTLSVSDDLAGDTGSIDSFALNLTTFAAAPTLDAVQSFNQTTAVPLVDVGVATSTIAVAGLTNNICKAVVRANIAHTFSADMDVTLTSPGGTVVTLTTDNAGGNDNVYTGTTWDDDANPAGAVPYTTNNGVTTDHAYVNLTVATPLVAEESMGAFLGESANGTWTLSVSDDLAGDTGTITDWGLDFTTCSCATSADLSITKTNGTATSIAGASTTYTIVASNAGPSADPAAVVTDTFAASLSNVSWTCVAAGGATCPANGTGNINTAVNLPSGGSATFTVTGTIAASATGTLVNTATIAASAGVTDPDPANNSATDTDTLASQADLSITLTDSPDPVTAGTNLTYVATATNAGPSDATDVSISLPLPANTTLVSATAAGGTCAATTCTFAGATAPGASRSATYVVTVAASVLNGSTITATASTTSTTTDPNPVNNSATTTTSVIAVADLVIGLTASTAQTLINVPVTFTATSQNLGPSDAQNVSITVTLTPDFRYSSHVATGATCTTPQIGNTGAVVCTWAGATAPGVTRTLTVVAYSNVEGNTAVNASTTSATTDPVANNNAAGVTVVVGYPFTEIPTLSQFGLMLLGLLVGLMGFVAVRRQA